MKFLMLSFVLSASLFAANFNAANGKVVCDVNYFDSLNNSSVYSVSKDGLLHEDETDLMSMFDQQFEFKFKGGFYQGPSSTTGDGYIYLSVDDIVNYKRVAFVSSSRTDILRVDFFPENTIVNNRKIERIMFSCRLEQI